MRLRDSEVRRSRGPEVPRSELLRQGLLTKISGRWHREVNRGWSLEWYWSAPRVSGGGVGVDMHEYDRRECCTHSVLWSAPDFKGTGWTCWGHTQVNFRTKLQGVGKLHVYKEVERKET